MEGFFLLFLAHSAAGQVALFVLGERVFAALHHLDQVHAKARGQGLGDLAGGQGVHHFFKLGHKHAGVDPAQIAPGLGRSVLRIFTGQLGKISPSHDAFAYLGDALAGGALGGLRSHAYQNMPRPRLRHGSAGQAHLLFLQNFEHMKACARAHQRTNRAHPQLLRRLDKQGRVAVGVAQAQHTAVGRRAGRVGELAHQGSKISPGVGTLQRTLGAALQSGHLALIGRLRHSHQNLRQVQLQIASVGVVLLIAQKAVHLGIGHAHAGFDLALAHAGKQHFVAQVFAKLLIGNAV